MRESERERDRETESDSSGSIPPQPPSPPPIPPRTEGERLVLIFLWTELLEEPAGAMDITLQAGQAWALGCKAPQGKGRA